MRVIVIDPSTKEVREEECDGALKSLQGYVGGYIEPAAQLPNGDVLYVNSEGLMTFDSFFDIGLHQLFAGPGVLVREDRKGGTTAARTPLTEVRSIVRFMDRDTALARMEGF